MPLPTGSATPWREIEDPALGDGAGSLVTYFRPGDGTGPYELLAEALRADGVVRSLGPALGAAERASLERGHFGKDDDGNDALCDAEGWTAGGGRVAEAWPCVLARVDAAEA